jgi:nucleotide-binding universal stress UspA family protein
MVGSQSCPECAPLPTAAWQQEERAIMTIQHILVPTDFSADAEQAVDYAIALASVFQARVTLLHVIYEVLWAAGETAMSLPPAYFAELEAATRQQMEQALQRIRHAGLEGDTIVAYGFPFEHIVTVARDQSVDLIIMGTQGRTGLRHVLLGSVAERVVRLAPCPVLVTRRSPPVS